MRDKCYKANKEDGWLEDLVVVKATLGRVIRKDLEEVFKPRLEG